MCLCEYILLLLCSAQLERATCACLEDTVLTFLAWLSCLRSVASMLSILVLKSSQAYHFFPFLYILQAQGQSSSGEQGV